jgi:signal transduction histidine kinase
MSTSVSEPPVVEIGYGEAAYDGYAGVAADPYVEPERASRLPKLPALSPAPIYAGVAIAAVGFALIAYAWSKVAGIADNVALQMPYLVSGGLTGLGLVMVGVTVINVAAKRRDALLRRQQTELLADALHELRTALDLGNR